MRNSYVLQCLFYVLHLLWTAFPPCNASSSYSVFYGQHSLPFWPSKTIKEMLPALRDT